MKLSIVFLVCVAVASQKICRAFTTPSSVCSLHAAPETSRTKRAEPPIDVSRRSGVADCRSVSTALFGIPKMFRWLTDQYPSINRRLSEGRLDNAEGVDNFYLDMNGIIHPCTHGNNSDDIVLLDETAMFKKIFGYVDRLYKIVRPRKLLYLAVDGVAPRAKMNQQRSRRFRSSREAEELASTILARDGVLPDQSTRFDSNCITPGTDFMLKLSLAMTRWIEYKQKTDPFWKEGADVVFTGPDVPGEGEHKVMDYIRDTRAMYNEQEPDKSHPHWRPGLTHVLYGLDADLIMLGLVTHEPNFMLLREKMSVVMAGRGRHKNRKKKDMLEYTRDDFELLELKMLRQMFQIQFRKFADDDGEFKRKGAVYDPYRIIDDFVFMCVLVGNDFLPHCPHLEIDNGALSLMLSNYIDLLPVWGGYLTNKEKIHPQRFEQFMFNVAAFEEEHFKRRGYEENEKRWQLSSENELDKSDFYGLYYGKKGGSKTPESAKLANRRLKKSKVDANGPTTAGRNGELLTPTANPNDSFVTGKTTVLKNNLSNASRSYRDFYYETKLNWSPRQEDRDETRMKRRAHVRDYIEGLHWVLNYYHNGCPSWEWYFPHLYSPLATDMVNLHEFYDDGDGSTQDEDGFTALTFEQSDPFPSLGQLLSVLPPQSANLLPDSLAELMIHPSSPIAEYYPRDFTTDANGKRQSWEAVVQIPFIDGDVLLEVVNSVIEGDKDRAGNALLSAAERRRNARGKSHLFVPPRELGGFEADYTAVTTVSPTYSRSPAPSRTDNGGGRGRRQGRGPPGRRSN